MGDAGAGGRDVAIDGGFLLWEGGFEGGWWEGLGARSECVSGGVVLGARDARVMSYGGAMFGSVE